jgi:hypothetical protein
MTAPAPAPVQSRHHQEEFESAGFGIGMSGTPGGEEMYRDGSSGLGFGGAGTVTFEGQTLDLDHGDDLDEWDARRLTDSGVGTSGSGASTAYDDSSYDYATTAGPGTAPGTGTGTAPVYDSSSSYSIMPGTNTDPDTDSGTDSSKGGTTTSQTQDQVYFDYILFRQERNKYESHDMWPGFNTVPPASSYDRRRRIHFSLTMAFRQQLRDQSDGFESVIQGTVTRPQFWDMAVGVNWDYSSGNTKRNSWESSRPYVCDKPSTPYPNPLCVSMPWLD